MGPCRTVEVVKMADKSFLSGTWDEFENWVKTKVGGEISWKVRPRDTKVNRMIVAESVLDTLNRNGGEFPPSGNPFLELERDEDSS
jgi:phage host-nuclease inhibitor protein Gam